MSHKVQNMVDELLEEFPEFISTTNYNIIEDSKDLPYIVYGAFSDYIIESVQNLEENNIIIIRFIDWVNKVFNSSKYSKEDINLLYITLFEPFSGSEKLKKFAEENFTGEALKWFKNCQKHFGT